MGFWADFNPQSCLKSHEYLNEIGYNNIVCLGSVPNMEKTKLGTPDTYCCLQNGDYVFVEYTTIQSGLYNKIKEDIDKCLQVSIPHETIRKILYYHNSANLKPEDDNKLKQYSLDHGIALEIYGIDAIATALYPYHQHILNEYLELPLTSGQIRSVSDFVKYYDRSPIVAPLNTEYISREKEFNEINDYLKTVDVVLLIGEAGVGKTRFGIEYLNWYSEKKKAKGLVIKSNNLEIYDELFLFINKPEEYIILIDDANELIQFGNIVKILRDIAQDRGYTIKILITVRRYAKQMIQSKLDELIEYRICQITNLSREQCEKMILMSFGNLNSKAIEQIHRVSKDNARLAYLMAKTAKESDSFYSISNVSSLYDQYYGSYIEKAGLKKSDEQLFIIAGTLSFWGGVNIDVLNPIEPILSFCHLTIDSFKSGINKLNQMEIVDIQFSKAAKITDQCLGNYFLKLVLLDKKWISISELIRIYFSSNTSKITNTINILLNQFFSNDTVTYIENQVKLLWNDWRGKSINRSLLFAECFGRMLPIDTLVFLDEYLDALDNEPNSNTLSVDDNRYLNICCRLFETEYTNDVINIFLRFYQKRSNCCSEFYKYVEHYFGPLEKSGLLKTIQFIVDLKEFSEQWENRPITQLALKTIDHFLGFEFELLRSDWTGTFSCALFQIQLNDSIKSFRKEIWNTLLELSRIPIYQEEVAKILYSYNKRVTCAERRIVEYDLDFYIKCLMSLSEQDEVLIAHIAHCMIKQLKILKIDIPHQLLQKQESPSYNLFCDYYRVDEPDSFFFDYNECDKEICLESMVKRLSQEQFLELISISSKVQNITWLEIENSSLLGFGLEALYHTNLFFKEASIAAINSELCIKFVDPRSIVPLLFNYCNDEELWKLCYTKSTPVLFNWVFEYFINLPDSFIEKKNIDRFLLFLQEWYIERPRSLRCVERFKSLDKDLNQKIYHILLKKSENEISNYFYTLFWDYLSEVDNFIRIHLEELELLSHMYCITKLHYPLLDRKGEYLIGFQEQNPRFIIDYIEKVVIKEHYYNSHHCELQIILSVEEYISILDLVFNYLIDSTDLVTPQVTSILNDILNSSEKRLANNRNTWIKHTIFNYCHNNKKMEVLFDIISSYSTEERIEYIKYFIDQTMDVDHLKAIALISRVRFWSGSEVPVIMKDIHFIEDLIIALKDTRYLKIRQYLNEEKDCLMREKHRVEIDEALY